MLGNTAMKERITQAIETLKDLSSRLMVAILIVALLGFLGLFLWQSLQIQKMQNEYIQKKADLAVVQERNDRLQEHLDFYKGPGYMLYVEKVAREALGLAKPGETVILTVPTGSPSGVAGQANQPNATGSPTDADLKKSNWQNWLEFFIGSPQPPALDK